VAREGEVQMKHDSRQLQERPVKFLRAGPCRVSGQFTVHGRLGDLSGELDGQHVQRIEPIPPALDWREREVSWPAQ